MRLTDTSCIKWFGTADVNLDHVKHFGMTQIMNKSSISHLKEEEGKIVIIIKE